MISNFSVRNPSVKITSKANFLGDLRIYLGPRRGWYSKRKVVRADSGLWSMSASVYLSSAPSYNSQFLACWSKMIYSSLSIRLSKEIRCFHPVLAVQFKCFVMVEHSSGGVFVIIRFKKNFLK